MTVNRQWASTLSLFNVSAAEASYRYIGFLGGGGPFGADGYCAPTTVHKVPAGQGEHLNPCVGGTLGGSGVGFLVIGVSEGLAAHASVSTVKELCNCSSLDCTSIPEGRALMPVFSAAFPSNSVAVTGEVVLGRSAIPTPCGTPEERYPRRVNVTLLNEGFSPATFSIRALPYLLSTAPILEQIVTVPARDVVQVNRLPLDLDAVAQIHGTEGLDGSVLVWIEISADQPFLAYTSTVFENGPVGSMPFEIYPPVLR